MAIRVAIHHHTEYHYDRLVALTPQLIRLRPAPHTRTPVLSYSLKLDPAEHFINWQQDPFGNFQARLVFPQKTRRLAITVELVAEMTVINPFDFFLEAYAEHWPFEYAPDLAKALIPYRELSESGPLLHEWLLGVSREAVPTADFLVAINQRLQRDIGYLVRMEPGVQSCEETLDLRSGSCRDSAWLLVQILRHLGLAARFVSGYLVQLTADVKALDGPAGPAQDFTDLHAWAEVYVPGAGWIGLDPTSGLFAGEGHIPLACTPSPEDAAPLTGSTEPCKTEFTYRNEVTRIHEDSRVTRPYTEAQWAEVMNLGRAVDADLERGDVRLTMGGEPTFVSVDDMDDPQWNTAALGDDKRRLADDLFRRLQARFAPGALLHRGQGKWYPGEPLPRWALTCVWRRDGEPVWREPRWLADEGEAGTADLAQAERFAIHLAERLDLDGSYVSAGYEDAYHYLHAEQCLPDNIDPLNVELDDPLARQRLARVLSRGLHQPVGYVLPVRWDEPEGRWRSSHWRFRAGAMYLLPGDSPMGFRLPLDALPWVEPTRRALPTTRDPFEPRTALKVSIGEVARRYARVESEGEAPAAEPVDADEWAAGEMPVAHTALCVEVRESRLCVFLPPVSHAEHFLALVTAVEDVAAKLGQAVIVEGYEPPEDPRLTRFKLTPDPGVIEVNVQPTASWDALVELTTTLYEEAFQTRLGTEKFMLDGRHTGTGGGNHVTLGGLTPADSPILRRPQLLRSLLVYWQHHPALSYLFSGLFIGPTSQAPRIDEARDDSLYELEIALQQLPPGETPAPWLVDRLLRNLLTDITGNTHRAEFCIDKLFSPQGPAGRLGLLEFRGFEMPPHPRMSAVQMLLLRVLVARFWNQPYLHRPVRWGTGLHDRFMLPHFVWADLQSVVEDLQRWGYAFDLQWFAPFLEFRFPHYGTVHWNGIGMELRAALEPWHVLGEEVTAMGTARYVDSSVERVQLRVSGLPEGRYRVVCNGRHVPLTPTGTAGEYVAGVRFKAWQPPSGLHPTIPRQGPLVFDLIDCFNAHAVAGCTYHVAHPGGRNYEGYPVNANEAEARRIARFRAEGHTPGVGVPPPEEPNPYLPTTLDLRYRPA
ncbi:IMP dehydrogenase [Acidihalobacter yilgarnensis]|uniref:IMP dehydrogenase n=1 Tax=Acidihalobacter yilgarnensis TaxID=2819280 RepID=A0A1D8IKZ7_9GAMM|nr:transglutaminase family protein [Acidihalobacter yilgarnensis]AOU97149.1 IMP dehydrogenase [Acidihalobacter yilgarnensis]